LRRKSFTEVDHDYLNYLDNYVTNQNLPILEKSCQMFDRVAENSPELIDQSTAHRLLIVCCMITIKYSYDIFSLKTIKEFLFAKKDFIDREKCVLSETARDELWDAEAYLFLEVFDGKLSFLS
jgi:hypothetical protein